MLEGRGDAGGVLTEGDHFHSPLDGRSLGLNGLAQDALSFVLRQEEEVIVGARDFCEIDMDEKLSFSIDVAAVCVMTNANKVIGKAAQF